MKCIKQSWISIAQVLIQPYLFYILHYKSRIKPMDTMSFQDWKILPRSWIDLEAAKAVKAETKVETITLSRTNNNCETTCCCYSSFAPP